MDFNDGSAFAFHKCLGCYVFYQFNRTYLQYKEKDYDAITVQADSLPRQFSGKKENEYSIMFYYTPEFAADNDFKDNPENLPLKELLKEKFEELVQKINHGYQNSNITIKARMHCFEEASTIRDNDSEDMIATLYKFKSMKGSPEEVLHSADVAVLLVHNFKDACGYGNLDAWKFEKETFSVVLKGCADALHSVSHEIAHNFGADHDLGYILNKKNEKGKYLRTIMAKEPEDRPDIDTKRTNFFTNPNIIHPTIGEPIGKLGKPSNYVYFAKHINQIASVGDESCKCHESCTFKPKAKPKNQKSKAKPGKAKQKLKKRNDNWKSKTKPGKAKKNLKEGNDTVKPDPISKQNSYNKYLTDVQMLYQNYVKADQQLYRKYLNDAHKKIHEMLQ